MTHLKTLTLLITISLASCNLAEKDIKKHSWKYSEGYHIGDWIEFNNPLLVLNKDTIYQSGKAIAKIISSKNNLFGKDNSITIESILTKEKGVYIEK